MDDHGGGPPRGSGVVRGTERTARRDSMDVHGEGFANENDNDNDNDNDNHYRPRL